MLGPKPAWSAQSRSAQPQVQSGCKLTGSTRGEGYSRLMAARTGAISIMIAPLVPP
jgi:hypothetical protein